MKSRAWRQFFAEELISTLAGIGTGAVRMRRFSGPEEFLVSLHDAEVLRRPKSLVYLQGLKWMAQAKERVR